MIGVIVIGGAVKFHDGNWTCWVTGSEIAPNHYATGHWGDRRDLIGQLARQPVHHHGAVGHTGGVDFRAIHNELPRSKLRGINPQNPTP
jgi:hypothetical protein